MRHTLFTLALAPVAGMANARHSEHSYTVEGLIDDSTLNGQTLYISRYDDGMKVNSTQVANRQSKFAGKADIPCFYRISAGREYAGFILEGGNIQVSVLTHNDPKGTPMNEEYTHISDKTSKLVTELRERRAVIEQQTEDKPEQLRLKKECAGTYRRPTYTRLYKDMFMENPDNALGESAMRKLAMCALPEETDTVFAASDPWLESLGVYRRIEEQFQGMKTTVVEQKFTDLSGKTMDGAASSLSDFVGKGRYTLVDFWANWCDPYRSESPHIAELYNTYEDRGLTVLGIAIWDKPENTKRVIKKLGIGWPQIIDTDMTPTDLYDVKGIPFILLFGPDRTIIACNLRGEGMKNRVAGVLNDK